MCSLFLWSCIQHKTEINESYCPQPQQKCTPGKWTGVPDDTSSFYQADKAYYYVINPVYRINTAGDEWQLAFVNDQKAILTYSDMNRNKIIMARVLNESEIVPDKGIDIPMSGNCGTVAIHGNNVFFANENYEDQPGNSDIYYASLKDNRILDPVNLSIKNFPDKFSWESQPSISSDGNVLFFATDNSRQLHGTDIYVSVKLKNGNWSNAINCGNIINTECDELTPFVCKDGKYLYFSSCGHETVGGYDIFKSKINEKFWNDVKKGDTTDIISSIEKMFSVPENLKPPINTPYDELFPTSSGDCDEILYYSSNQSIARTNYVTNLGGFDIYVRRKISKVNFAAYQKKEREINDSLVISQNPVETNLKLPETGLLTDNKLTTFNLEGTVYSDITKKPISDAQITVLEISRQGMEQGHSITGNSDVNGKYSIELIKNKEYDVMAQARNYFYEDYRLNVPLNDTSRTIRKDFYIPQMYELRINFPNDVYNDPYRFTLDSNGIETGINWQEELENLSDNIKSSGEMIEKVILVGHTDDVASVEYNRQLGKKRVDFVISELIKLGVDQSLLEGRSAGKLEPLPRRSNEPIESYRKRLRRVELIKVLKK
jgi:outer membrane protein OmpA-like peptidoglycan-associated protein